MMDYILATADPQCWSVPQADLHAALLVNLVTAGSADPVLRWWYYPSANQTSALVLDSDDDWSAQSAFNALIDAVERLDGHVTMYLMMGPTTGSVLTPEQVQTWRERGHSFGIHHDHYDAVYTGRDEAEIFPGNLEADLVAFAGRYTGRPRVNRNHCLGWVGYVETAKFWAEQGIVMDSNVGSYGESWGGYVAGTGRPLRFVDEDGTVVDCFQQPHLVYDDLTVLERLRDDTEAEVARMVAWIDEIATTWYHPFVVLSHPVSFEGYSARFQVAVWTAAVERGLPFWSMEEWADFVAARDGFRLEPCEGGSRVRAPHALGCATLAVPAGQHAPHVVVDGVEVDGVRRDVLGQEYLLVTVPDGAIVSLGQTGQQR